MKFLDTFNVDRPCVVLAVNYNLNFILTNPLPDQNVYLTRAFTLSAIQLDVVENVCIRRELFLDFGD